MKLNKKNQERVKESSNKIKKKELRWPFKLNSLTE